MTREERAAFRNHRREAKRAAKELFYGEEVVKKIEAAKDSHQIDRILIDARHAAQG